MRSPPPPTRNASPSGTPSEPLLPVEIIDAILEEFIATCTGPSHVKSQLLPLALVSHTFAALANRRIHASHYIVLDFPSHTQYYDRINSLVDLLENSRRLIDVGAVYHLKRLVIFAEGKSHITRLFMDVLESPQFSRLLSLLHGKTYGIREFELQLELGLTDVWRWNEFPRLGGAIGELARSPGLRTMKMNNLRGVPRDLFAGSFLKHLSLVNIRAEKHLADSPCRNSNTADQGFPNESANHDPTSDTRYPLSPLLLDTLEVDDVTGIPIDLLHFDRTTLGKWDRYDEALAPIQEITYRTEFGGTLYSLRDFIGLLSQIKLPALKVFRAVVARPFCCMSSPSPSFNFASLPHIKTLKIETDSEEYMSNIISNSRFHRNLTCLQLTIRASLVRTETCRYLARTLSKLPAIQAIKKVDMLVECAVILPLFGDTDEDFSGKWLSELPASFNLTIRQQESAKR